MKKRTMRWSNWYLSKDQSSSSCSVSNTDAFDAPACWSATLVRTVQNPKYHRVQVNVGSWRADFTNVASEASAKRWAGLVARELLDLYDRVHGRTRQERLRRKTLEFDPMLASKAKR